MSVSKGYRTDKLKIVSKVTPKQLKKLNPKMDWETRTLTGGYCSTLTGGEWSTLIIWGSIGYVILFGKNVIIRQIWGNDNSVIIDGDEMIRLHGVGTKIKIEEGKVTKEAV